MEPFNIYENFIVQGKVYKNISNYKQLISKVNYWRYFSYKIIWHINISHTRKYKNLILKNAQMSDCLCIYRTIYSPHYMSTIIQLIQEFMFKISFKIIYIEIPTDTNLDQIYNDVQQIGEVLPTIFVIKEMNVTICVKETFF